MTETHLAEAIHIATNWRHYHQSLVMLANRVLRQRGITL